MYFPAAHLATVAAAIQIPALTARLALLAGDAEDQAKIHLYAGMGNRTPGEPPSSDPVITFTLPAVAGVVDEENGALVFDAPLDSLVTAADPVNGSCPFWGRIERPNGDLWAEITVSVEGG